jgi:hypothetical protein
MATWQRADLINQEVAEILSDSIGAVEEVTGLFETLVGLLADVGEFIAQFQVDRVNGFLALIQAVIEQIQNAINDFRNSGAYLLLTYPTSIEDSGGLPGFIQQVAQSFEDKNDKNRPQFSDNATFYAFVGLAGATSPLPIFQQLQNIGKLAGSERTSKADFALRLLNQPHAILQEVPPVNQRTDVTLEFFPNAAAFPSSGLLDFGSEVIRYTKPPAETQINAPARPYLDIQGSKLKNAYFKFPHRLLELVRIRTATDEWNRDMEQFAIGPDQLSRVKNTDQAPEKTLNLNYCYTTNTLLPRPSPVAFPTTTTRTRIKRDAQGNPIIDDSLVSTQTYTVEASDGRLVTRTIAEGKTQIPETETVEQPANLMGFLEQAGAIEGEGSFGFEYAFQQLNLTNLPQVRMPALEADPKNGIEEQPERYFTPSSSGFCRIGDEVAVYRNLTKGGEPLYEPFTEPVSLDVLATERHEIGEPVVFLQGTPDLPSSQFPDWSSFTLAGLFPFLGEVFSGIDSILNGILLTESSNNALLRTVRAITQSLTDLGDRIEAISDALSAFQSLLTADLSFLTISGVQGQQGFITELQNAENAPDFPQGTFVVGFVALTATPGVNEQQLEEMVRNIFDKPLEIPPKLKETLQDPLDVVFGGSAFDTLSKIIGG